MRFVRELTALDRDIVEAYKQAVDGGEEFQDYARLREILEDHFPTPKPSVESLLDEIEKNEGIGLTNNCYKVLEKLRIAIKKMEGFEASEDKTEQSLALEPKEDLEDFCAPKSAYVRLYGDPRPKNADSKIPDGATLIWESKIGTSALPVHSGMPTWARIYDKDWKVIADVAVGPHWMNPELVVPNCGIQIGKDFIVSAINIRIS